MSVKQQKTSFTVLNSLQHQLQILLYKIEASEKLTEKLNFHRIALELIAPYTMKCFGHLLDYEWMRDQPIYAIMADMEIFKIMLSSEIGASTITSATFSNTASPLYQITSNGLRTYDNSVIIQIFAARYHMELKSYPSDFPNYIPSDTWETDTHQKCKQLLDVLANTDDGFIMNGKNNFILTILHKLLQFDYLYPFTNAITNNKIQIAEEEHHLKYDLAYYTVFNKFISTGEIHDATHFRHMIDWNSPDHNKLQNIVYLCNDMETKLLRTDTSYILKLTQLKNVIGLGLVNHDCFDLNIDTTKSRRLNRELSISGLGTGFACILDISLIHSCFAMIDKDYDKEQDILFQLNENPSKDLDEKIREYLTNTDISIPYRLKYYLAGLSLKNMKLINPEPHNTDGYLGFLLVYLHLDSNLEFYNTYIKPELKLYINPYIQPAFSKEDILIMKQLERTQILQSKKSMCDEAHMHYQLLTDKWDWSEQLELIMQYHINLNDGEDDVIKDHTISDVIIANPSPVIIGEYYVD